MREKTEQLPKWAKPSPHKPSSARDKEGGWGTGLRHQRGRRQFTWRRKSKYWVNKCLLAQQRLWDTECTLISKSFPTTHSPYSLQTSLVIILFF